jgi:hypothetical protein
MLVYPTKFNIELESMELYALRESTSQYLKSEDCKTISIYDQERLKKFVKLVNDILNIKEDNI